MRFRQIPAGVHVAPSAAPVLAGIEEQPNRRPRLGTEHLEKDLLQPQVGAPVDRSKVISLLEVPMVKELVADTGVARDVLAAQQPVEGVFPTDGKALQTLQRAFLEQWRRCLHVINVSV